MNTTISQSVQPQSRPAFRRPSGLRYWMEKVLEECDQAVRDLSPEKVHDLRTALRRCRTMADGFMPIDSCKTWKVMKKEAGKLCKALGGLRDVQIMMEWILRLRTADDPAAARMMDLLAQREEQLKQTAFDALGAFDRKKWRTWSNRLQARSRGIPLEGTVFQLNALQAWNDAYERHKEALRNRSNKSFHALRVGLKKLRYIVENFLPLRHEKWGQDFKDLQDWLGEIHDLAVLWDAAVRMRAFPDMESRNAWRDRISGERGLRIERYREKTLGPGSLWIEWRSGLPAQRRLRQAALQWLRKSAFFRNTDLTHARRVRTLALQLHGGLASIHPMTREEIRDERSILHAAAIFHEVGRTAARKKHGKSSARQLRRLPPLPGFPRELLLRSALIVRYHDGGLGILEDQDLAGLEERVRQSMIRLTAVLRLAEALARHCNTPISRILVHHEAGSIIIEAAGYVESCRRAERLARARYLLEFAYNQPVLIRGTASPPASASGAGTF